MALSDIHRLAVTDAAEAAAEAGKKAQDLQNMAQRITPEGTLAYVVELSIARAEAVATQRVLESLIRSS